MAEILVSFAVDKLLSKAISLAAEEATLAWGFKEELTRLSKSSLPMIQALLRDAGKRQEEDDAVREWLNKVKDIACDAEDVLDELTYETLRRQVELQKQKRKKVRNFFSLSNPIAFRLEMGRKIKNINISLEEIKGEANIYGLVRSVDTTTPAFNLDRETDSFVDESKVIGRENDASKIVKMIINSTNNEGLSIIPIVGMAGLGKTTFAQLVYNHNEIKSRFDVSIWVCVSDNFEAKRILSECLESLDPAKGKMENMNAILGNLQKELGGKRYLLVLDDVWNEDPEKWDSLKSRLVLINTTKGSTIIVTTRSDQVASVMETLPRHHLKALSEDECWSVFKDRAFADGGAPMTQELEAIGREIVKKCAGVPLAAKVLGGMMRSKNEKDEWLSVQNSEFWKLPEDKNGILPALKLSFDHLPSLSLKQCFAYCSMFPKDFMIEKDNLVQLWMAQGLLQPSQENNLEMEDVGNKYFNILLVNSLFQDYRKDEFSDNGYCKMHDMVHDLAQSLLKFDSSALEVSKANDRPQIRHLPLMTNREILPREILPTIPKEIAGKVRTLFSMCNVDLGNMLSNLTRMRALNLDRARIEELPSSIGKLKHLRYLDASRTKIKRFPKSIGKLYNLQTLRLMYCEHLEEFPNQLKNLISMKHFCINEYYRPYRLIKQMPVDMGLLTCLQTLPYFAVGQERGRQIEELGCLSKLRGKLKICQLEHVRNGEEAKKAKLVEKGNISQLRFEWSRSSGREGSNINDEDVLEGLQPHSNLKSLSIFHFEGHKFPMWIMKMAVSTRSSSSLLPLNNLVTISLDDCNKCEQIPMLGHLPCLRNLYINGMNNVKCIGVEFYGASNTVGPLFPKLRTFKLRSMGNLTEWMEAVTEAESRVVFPCLEELEFWGCPLLTTAPSHFSYLRALKIWSSNPALVNYISSNLTTLTTLQIDNVAELRFLPEGVLENNKNLESLNIYSCPELTNIVPHVLGCCTSLRSLAILDCKKLNYLPNDLHTLMSLEELSIGYCSNLESIPSIHGLTSLRKLRFSNCDGLTTLPTGLQSCTSLENLTIQSCSSLMSVPDELQELCFLSVLGISNCGQLKCLPEWLHCLTRLRSLEIGGFWKELEFFPNFDDILQLHHASLRDLTLCGWPKLNSLPHQLQHLTALTSLSIKSFNGVEALPEWLGNLSSLQQLEIHDCNNLIKLPQVEAMRRLRKLQRLSIFQCPLLKEGCTEGSGAEWSKISHVPLIQIFPQNQRLCYRILHGSNSLAEEKKLFREIKQVEETKEKVVAYAAATKKWDSLGPKEATLDQINLLVLI